MKEISVEKIVATASSRLLPGANSELSDVLKKSKEWDVVWSTGDSVGARLGDIFIYVANQRDGVSKAVITVGGDLEHTVAYVAPIRR